MNQFETDLWPLPLTPVMRATPFPQAGARPGGGGLGGGGRRASVAPAHQAVRLIRLPTAVLAQNDSAMGVKTSVNAFGKKNFLGTFTPPYAVLNDACFLTTLSERDWRSGIAEAIKVALIKDAAFFGFI